MSIPLFCMVVGSETVRTFTNKCLIKFLRSVGLMLSQMKNCGGVCKKNQWQCKPSCRNARESGIQKEFFSHTEKRLEMELPRKT
jgi:hypothetical protein